MKVNGKEVEWEDPPKEEILTDVKIKTLWRDEKTGAHFRLMKIPVGGVWENPHFHPEASHWSFMVSGEIEFLNRTQMKASEDNYVFMNNPKGEKHAFYEGAKVVKEWSYLEYFDGPSKRVLK